MMDDGDATIVDSIVINMTRPGCIYNNTTKKRCTTETQVRAGSVPSFSKHHTVRGTIRES